MVALPLPHGQPAADYLKVLAATAVDGDISSAPRDESVLGGDISADAKQWEFPPWKFSTLRE